MDGHGVSYFLHTIGKSTEGVLELIRFLLPDGHCVPVSESDSRFRSCV
jgi:hypothetical protein